MTDKNNIYYLAQKKKEQKKYKKQRNYKKPIIYILFFLIIVFISYYYISHDQIDVAVARYGELVDGFSTEALIIRDESNYKTPYSGKIELMQEEGSRVSYGQSVIKIEKKTIYNKAAGLISYASDGLEEKLSPGKVKNMNLKEFQSYKRNFKQLTNNNYLNKGETAYRVINSNIMLLVIRTNIKELERYRLNEKVFIKHNIKQDLITGKVLHKYRGEKDGLLIIELNPFIEEWLNIRRVDINFIKNIYRGVLIPKNAVFTQPGGQGVLVVSPDRKIQFKKVKILERNHQTVIISGIEAGESVIANPESVNYGKGVDTL
ncbi:MAG: HlyD family efflux transporter periplasmic adaptor subunit [Halanaerobiales bacterium]